MMKSATRRRPSSTRPVRPTTVLFTGFPGFIGMRLLPRLMELSPRARFRCLVQSRFLEAARQGLAVVRTLELLQESLDRAPA